VINLVGTVVALLVIDRLGRKPLLITATGGMAVSLAALVMAFLLGASGWIVLLPVLAYVAFFAVGLGPGVWVLMSELFPTAVRGRAMSVATVSLWTACTVITLTFLSLVNAVTIAGAFAVYAALSVFTLIFVWRGVPETEGRTLEEIERSWE
jgi:MFS family permease